MLLTAARVLRREIHHAALPSEKPARSSRQLQRVERRRRRAFEDVHAPRGGRWRKACFGRFVVFQHDTGARDGVGFGGKFAAGGEVGGLFLGRGGLRGGDVGGRAGEGGFLGGEWGEGAFVWLGGWGLGLFWLLAGRGRAGVR